MDNAPPPPDAPAPQPPPRRDLPLLRFLAYAATIAAAAGLLFAHLWPSDVTSTSRPFVLVSHAAFLVLTVQFHLGLALLAVALFAAANRRRRLLLVSAAIALPALAPALWSYRPRSLPQPPPGADVLTVMSANLLYSRADADALAEQIAAHNPDVILFQEYSSLDRARLAPILDDRYPHRAAVERDDAFGQAVYSRRPFLSQPRNYPPGNQPPGGLVWFVPQITVQVDLAGSPVSITNVHVLPPVSLEYIITHRLQAGALADLAAADVSRGRSVILAGDLNAAPRSHHYRAMERAGLREAHHLAGRGRGTTWPRTGALAHLPGIRLDHVFLSPDLLCLHAATTADTGSDHKPVVARVTRRPPLAPARSPATPGPPSRSSTPPAAESPAPPRCP